LLIERIDMVTAGHRHLYLSPHFDDVVYSCGGAIALRTQAGEGALVITVFAGQPDPELKLSALARKLQRAMGFEQDTAALLQVRRREDSQACGLVQADYLWLEYLDAIYRGSPPLYRWARSIGGSVHARDAWIEQDLFRRLLSLHERFPALQWYAPLGIGRHVDHQVVAAVAARLSRCGASVTFYEDFPYVLQPRALQRRLRELRLQLDPLVVEISSVLHLRQKAAELHASQVGINFGSLAALYRSIAGYSRQIGSDSVSHAERYWLPRRT
jgi:LmbE family N-acetylglucosaminyl deacetylase